MSWLGTKVFTAQSKYNIEELNRVNNNISFLASKLTSYGYAIILTKPVETTRDIKTLPYIRLFNEARLNIQTIIDNYYTVDAPALTISEDSIVQYTFKDVNVLEYNLAELYATLSLMEQSFKYVGTFTAGQEVIL